MTAVVVAGSEGGAQVPPLLSVPRQFHFVWFGAAEADPNYMTTWEEHHPDWRGALWTDDNDWSWLHNYDLFENASEYAPGSEGQFKADIARYELLWAAGGVYVDLDFECRRNIEDLIRGAECFAAWEEQDRWVNNAIMGAIPQDEFLGVLIDNLAANVDAKRGQRPNVMTGPQYVTKMHATHDGLTVFDQALFYPYRYDELDRGGESFPEAYAVHHWNNQRRRRGIPL